MKPWLLANFLLTVFLIQPLYAQQHTLSGSVAAFAGHAQTQYLQGAVILVPGTSVSALSADGGLFSLSVPDSAKVLVISFTGYDNDTLPLARSDSFIQVLLQKQHALGEVVVKDRLKTTEVSLMGDMKTENIGLGELQKAACCNLSESFETTPSVDVAFTDAVTGYKQIRLLGLAGANTMITRENIPDSRGLAAVTGLTYTPGPWIESMQLSKGVGSVVNGYESIAGQINVELLKPFAGDTWMLNLYQSSQGRTEADVMYRKKINKNLATNLMVHYGTQWLKLDQNIDHFLDQPLGNQLIALNRWIYNGPNGWMVQAGVKFVYAAGYGGEWNYQPGDPQSEGNPWGYKYTNLRVEDWAKFAKIFSGRQATSVGLQLSNVNHYNDNFFGPREYLAVQNTVYANLIFQTYIGNLNNVIKAGSSLNLDICNEQFSQINYYRNERTPGVFAEFSSKLSDKFSFVAGIRGDFDNLYGFFVTPRLHVRYAPFKRTTIRASVGRAQRTADIFSENIGFMASNRQFDILNPVSGRPYGLDPEVAWNAGLNLVHKFTLANREAALSLDYYYTWFQQQVVVDIDNPGFVNFYNLNGQSYAHSFSAQFDYEVVRHLDVRLAWRYFLVMTTYAGTLEEKPLVPASRAFLDVAYTTNNKWKFDFNIQSVGTERTPGVTHVHPGITPGGPNRSPSFLQMNFQVTKVFTNRFELYGGCENLDNFMQHDAIIGASNPYGRSFDASLIWGPMMGRNVYLGARYKIF